jgi:hypothetical protein
MKLEQCSETSAYKIRTPRNYPEESIQQSEHGESLKSRRKTCNYSGDCVYVKEFPVLTEGFVVLTKYSSCKRMSICGAENELVLGGCLWFENRVARLRMLSFENWVGGFTSVEGPRYLECGLPAELLLLFIYCYLLYKCAKSRIASVKAAEER